MTKVRVGLVLLALLVAAPTLAQEESKSPSPSRPSLSNGRDDPTENVKALSEAANKRQDDLRLAAERLTTARLEALERHAKLLADHNKDLREAAVVRLDAEAKLRAEYTDRLLIAESKRIDAIRAVDVNAVAVASTRAADSATVLAAQVSQSAETLRALVATTAATVAASQQQLANTLSARLTTLEQAGYQQAGKQTFQDPAFIEALRKIESISRVQADSASIGSGRSDVIAWVFAVIGAIVGIGGILLAVFKTMSSSKA